MRKARGRPKTPGGRPGGIDELKIEAFLVSHDPAEPAYGYRVTYKGRSAVVSGDTRKVQNMVRFSRDADVLVHEALNPQMVELVAAALDKAGHVRQAKMTRDTLDYHTSPVEAAGIANEANVKLLVLTHVVPALPTALMRQMFLRDVKAVRGSGDTILGEDRGLNFPSCRLAGDRCPTSSSFRRYCAAARCAVRS